MGEFYELAKKDEYKHLLARLQSQCELQRIGFAQGFPIYQTVINPNGNPTLVFLSGIHGNERSGPWGIAHYLESNPQPKQRLVILPCCNPSGFEDNKRRSRVGLDINRHFKSKPIIKECQIVYEAILKEDPKLVIALHENLEDYCFLYYTGLEFTGLCKNIIKLARKYFSIYDGWLDGPHTVKCTRCNNGLVHCVNTGHNTLEDRLCVDGITTITTELPTKHLMNKRVLLTKKIIELITETL